MSCPYNLAGSSAHLSKTKGFKGDENEEIILCDCKVTKQWLFPHASIAKGLWNLC